MTVIDGLALAIALVALGVLLAPRVRRATAWRATVTPLASIIGSGFLVVGPILADTAGNLAVPAMAGLCALAWLFGAVVRFNIAHAEPLRGTASHPRLQHLDRLAELALAGAYFISVGYYLNLLGAYLLKGFGVVDPTLARLATSAVVVALGVLGFRRGFAGEERVEVIAVSFKLAVIAGVLAALLVAPVTARSVPAVTAGDGAHVLRVLLGCVILVQGFETSRFLGADYDAATRIRSMRWAQALSSAIYVAFIALVLPYLPHGPLGAASETAIVDVVGRVANVLGPLLVVAALASQLSAAVADMGGAGGLLDELAAGRLGARLAYPAIAAVVLVLTWTTGLYSIIALASRAFALYYLLQCLLAAALAGGVRRVLFGIAAVLALAVVVLGLPAG